MRSSLSPLSQYVRVLRPRWCRPLRHGLRLCGLCLRSPRRGGCCKGEPSITGARGSSLTKDAESAQAGKAIKVGIVFRCKDVFAHSCFTGYEIGKPSNWIQKNFENQWVLDSFSSHLSRWLSVRDNDFDLEVPGIGWPETSEASHPPLTLITASSLAQMHFFRDAFKGRGFLGMENDGNEWWKLRKIEVMKLFETWRHQLIVTWHSIFLSLRLFRNRQRLTRPWRYQCGQLIVLSGDTILMNHWGLKPLLTTRSNWKSWFSLLPRWTSWTFSPPGTSLKWKRVRKNRLNSSRNILSDPLTDLLGSMEK